MCIWTSVKMTCYTQYIIKYNKDYKRLWATTDAENVYCFSATRLSPIYHILITSFPHVLEHMYTCNSHITHPLSWHAHFSLSKLTHNFSPFTMWVTLQNTGGIWGMYAHKHTHIHRVTSHCSWFGSFVQLAACQAVECALISIWRAPEKETS